jgi:hypothetical protein
METATAQPPQKRARFDLTNETAAKVTPLSSAKASLEHSCASLQPDLTSLFSTLGQKHLLNFHKLKNKQTQVKKLSDDVELIPRSARVNFALTCSKEVEKDNGYISLRDETRTLVTDFQKALKAKIIAVTKLEIQNTFGVLRTSFAAALLTCTKALLICDGSTTDPHVIVSTLLGLHSTSLLLHLETSLDDFKQLYATQHSLEALPAAIALPPGDDGTVPMNDTTRTVSKFKRILLDTFVAPWSTYLATAQRNEISTQLKSLEVESLVPPATDAASLLLDSEPSADPPQLRAIIDAQVSSKTATLQKDLANLRSKLESFSKNDKRGQTPGASNKKKSTQKKNSGKATSQKRKQAADDDKDSSAAAKKPGQNNTSATTLPQQSNKKSKKKKRRSNKRSPIGST